MSMDTVSMNDKKKNKLKGFSVKILDDGSYLMRTDNTNYEMCKEYSYKNMDELHKGMKSIMGKMGNGNSHKEDMLSKKY